MGGFASRAKTRSAGLLVSSFLIASATPSVLGAVEDEVAGSTTTGTMVIAAPTILGDHHDGTIVISGDDLFLDCGGFTISGTGTGITITSRSGVTIRNCRVEGFTVGVDVDASAGVVVHNSWISQNTRGVSVTSSDAVTVRDNQISRNDTGVHLDATDAAVVRNNQIIDGVVGASAERSTDLTIRDNQVHRHDTAGISVDGSGTNVSFNSVSRTPVGVDLAGALPGSSARANLTSDNSVAGVSVSSSDGVELVGNRASGPGSAMVIEDSSGMTVTDNRSVSSDGVGTGVSLIDSSDSVVNENLMVGFDIGFRLAGDGGGNTLVGNMARSSTTVGISDASDVGAAPNLFDDNRCLANKLASSPPGLCEELEPSGYRLLGSDGAVFSCGDALVPCTRGDSRDVAHHGDPLGAGVVGGTAAVSIDTTPTLEGYVVLLSDGRITAHGDADHHGDVTSITNGLDAGDEVASVSMTPTGLGYWVFTRLGRVIAFGDAHHLGDLPDLGVVPADPIVASVALPDGSGYYMLGADGGVFAFPLGVTAFHGSLPMVLGTASPNCPIVGIVPTPTGQGYWLVGCDGGVFAFGDAHFVGSLPGLGVTQLNSPVIGMVAFGASGYLMVAGDGGVFVFGAPFFGSLGSVDAGRIVAITPHFA